MDDMAAAYYHQPPPATSHQSYYARPASTSHAAQPLPPGAPLPPPTYPHFYQSHHQPPAYDAPYAASSARLNLHRSEDEVRTLFIAGLPDDVKPREIYNLFREFPGYQSAQLRSTGQSAQAYAFAVFDDKHSALAAMHALNGIMFDLERESTLHIDLAKSNSRSKRSRSDDGPRFSSDKRTRGSDVYSRGFPDAGSGSNIHMPGMINTAYSLNGYASTQSHTNFGYEYVDEPERHKRGSSLTTHGPQDNPPCPTLFVANLGPTSSEKELTQLFSRCPGFIKLKLQNKNGVPVAFVDFKDIPSSTGALNHLQGTILYSSVGEGMRLEYAKSRMGLRKRGR